MTHEAPADIPSRTYMLAKLALGVATVALGVAGACLTLHHM